MSTIEDVRAAEKHVQEILQKLAKTGASDPNRLQMQLKQASDDYANLVSELEVK